MAMRNYTSKQIAPLLKAQDADLEALAGDLAGPTPRERSSESAAGQALRRVSEATFHPQTVPAFGATEGFNYLRTEFPDYSYKEATLDPTNPRDKTTDWEADVVSQFRNVPSQKEDIGERNGVNGKSMFLARPITITDAGCLECHSTPDKAPPRMLKLYGRSNGFHWKLGETIGAQIVTVPMSLPVQMADAAFRALMLSLVGVFAVILFVLNVVVYFTIMRPVSKMTRMADEVSDRESERPGDYRAWTRRNCDTRARFQPDAA